jgi:hypothetical protein
MHITYVKKIMEKRRKKRKNVSAHVGALDGAARAASR